MADFWEEDWKKTKKKFIVGIIFSSIMIIIFLLWPKSKITEKDFIKEQNKIVELKPIFKEESHGKNTKYLVEIHFKDDGTLYEISGIEFNFLKNEEFENEINIGDTVSITRFENEIMSISKNGKDYLNYRKAENNRLKTNKFLGLLFIPIFIICFIPLFFKRKPSIKILNKEYEIQFDAIIIIVFIITFIILKLNIEFEFITNGEFIKY